MTCPLTSKEHLAARLVQWPLEGGSHITLHQEKGKEHMETKGKGRKRDTDKQGRERERQEGGGPKVRLDPQMCICFLSCGWDLPRISLAPL